MDKIEVNLTQIDFNRPPEQWRGELFELIKRAIVEINDTIGPNMQKMDDKLDELFKAVQGIKRSIE